MPRRVRREAGLVKATERLLMSLMQLFGYSHSLVESQGTIDAPYQ